MRCIIRNGDFAAVRIYNGTAQRQSQPQAAAAVGNFIRSAVKHIKHTLLHFIGYPVAVIGNGYNGLISLLPGFDQNIRAFRRVFNGVVHNVDDNLHQQLCVHFGKKIIFFMPDGNMMFCAFAVHMMKRFSDDIVHQILCNVKIQPSLFNSCDRKQIFHQINKPHGVIVNIGIELVLCRFVKGIAV